MIRRIVLTAALCVALSSSALAQVKLEYKFREGRNVTSQTTTKIKQTLTLAGTNIETAADQVVTGTTVAGKRAADGTLPIVDKVDQMRFHLEIMGMPIDFDTADPNAKIALPQLAFIGDVCKALIGLEFTLVLDEKNKVKEVGGIDKALEKTKDLDPMAQEMLKDRLTAEHIQRDFEKSHGNLPTILVREGEPWEQTEVDDIGSGQTLTFRRKYEYKGTVDHEGKKLDKITITALDVKYAMDPDTKSPLKVTKSDLKVESSQGEMLFDREEGVVVKRTSVTHIKGDMDFKIGEMDLPGKLDLTLDTTTENKAPEKAAK